MLQYERYFSLNKPPVETDKPLEAETRRYEQTVNRLARLCIYNEEGLDQQSIEQAIEEARTHEDLAAIESERHELESIALLFEGIEAHEHANLYHNGAWQAELLRQTGLEDKTPKAPETLTREHVARMFDRFKFKQQLIDAEAEAVEKYERLLEINPNAVIQLSDNISVESTDIAVLINDIKVRMSERIPDEEERKTKLQELDSQLAEIIDHIPDEQWGKRFEMEEVYLLRRLIHAADTGHLASVSHGTPRDDLRRDYGSVDIELTAASDCLRFQLKTFKRGVSAPTRGHQADVLKKAKRTLKSPQTNLVVLEMEAVQAAYDASLRQSKHVQTKKADKYAALQPLVDVIPGNKHHRLIALLGLTEKDFEEERISFEEKTEMRKQIEEELRLKREQDQEREAAAERSRQEAIRAEHEKQLQEQEEERKKQEALLEQQEEARTTSLREREAVQAAKQQNMNQKQVQRQKDKEFLERIAAARQKELDEIEEKRRKREQKKLKEQEAPPWPPKTLAGLSNAIVLKNIGLLPTDWENDIPALVAAKKRFVLLFAKPKNKQAPPAETDKPNDFFKQVFPTKEMLESPTHQDLSRLRTIL